MKKIILLLLVLIAMLCACDTQSSDEVEVSAIWQDYYYFYNEIENKTHALAEFRNGGALGNDVILYAPSAITVNGETMKYHSVPYDLLYHHYGVITDGKIDTGTYIFTDQNSKNYTNIASFDGMDMEFPENFNTVSKSKDLVFAWVGSPIGEDEEFTLTFSIYQDSLISNSFKTSEVGATSILIPSSQLSVLINGTQKIELERDKNSDLQAATAKGGKIVVRLYTQKTVAIID